MQVWDVVCVRLPGSRGIPSTCATLTVTLIVTLHAMFTNVPHAFPKAQHLSLGFLAMASTFLTTLPTPCETVTSRSSCCLHGLQC